MISTAHLSIREFINDGYLHEVNRLLLHPLGLALQVTEEAVAAIVVWDCRSDPEGVRFGEDMLSAEKATQVAQQMFERRAARREKLGYVIQPVETERPTLTTTYINPAERKGRMLCERCGNPLGFGGHGPGFCLDRSER